MTVFLDVGFIVYVLKSVSHADGIMCSLNLITYLLLATKTSLFSGRPHMGILILYEPCISMLAVYISMC